MQFTEKMIREVDYGELERAVSFFHGTPYSVEIAVEGKNDTQHAVTVDGGPLGDWDADKLKKWQESGKEGYSPAPRVVLAPMVQAGVIPAGEYLIDLSY